MDHSAKLAEARKGLFAARQLVEKAWGLVADHADRRSAMPAHWDASFRNAVAQIDDLIQDTRRMMPKP